MKFDIRKHHAPVEYHELTVHDLAILMAAQNTIDTMQNLMTAYIASKCINEWQYPTGERFNFVIDWKTNRVQVMLVNEGEQSDSSKSNNSKE